MNTTTYSKLPTLVNKAMQDFANSECVLVKKLPSQYNKPLNCHFNVQSQIRESGGKVVNGWLLNKNSKIIGMDMWCWSFHSIWETDSGDWYDITIDKSNAREFSTFFADNCNRKIDLVNGVSYNDIVIFNNESPNNVLKGGNSPYLKYGEVFWTASNMTIFKALAEGNGEYRFLLKEYPNNFKLLEKQYKIKYVDGRIITTDGATHINQYVSMDFSVTLRR